MAIDSQGQVTTTGMLNKPNMNVEAPNMSSLVQPEQEVRQSVQVDTQPVENTPSEIGIIENIQNNITAEDMTVLAPILSPSVKSVLTKIVPEIAPLLEGVGTSEETVPIKVSTFTSLPGDIQDFIIQSSTEQMDTNNVPLDTTKDTTGMMARSQDDSSDIPQNDSAGVDINQDLV